MLTSRGQPMLLLTQILLLVLHLGQQSWASTIEAEVCSAASPVQVITAASGNVIELPLLVSLRQSASASGYGCSDRVEDTWPSIKAVQWALQQLNANSGTFAGATVSSSYIPDATFSLTVHDTCRGAQTVASLLTRSAPFPQIQESASSCSGNGTLVPAVLGGSTLRTTEALSNVLSSLQAPVVSFMAAESELDNRVRFPNVFRTVPNEVAQVTTLVSVLQRYNWTRIGVVYTSDSYSSNTLRTLTQSANSLGICIEAAVAFSSQTPSSGEVTVNLQRLLDAGVGAAVSVASLTDSSVLFTNSLSVQFQWLLSDSVSGGSQMQSLQSQTRARGLTAVVTGYRQNDAFRDFFLNELARIAGSSDPNADVEFKQWYMQQRKCTLTGMTNAADSSAPACAAFNLAAETAAYRQDRFVQPAIDAAVAVARTVRQRWVATCGTASTGLCAGLRASTYSQMAADLAATDFSYSSAERIASFASSTTPPELRSKRLQLGTDGTVQQSEYFVENLQTVSGSDSFVRVGVFLNGIFTEWNISNVKMYDTTSRASEVGVASFSCSSGRCGSCVGSPPSLATGRVPGDLLVLGLFSVHSPGPDPRSCGTLNPKGASELDAFLYALTEGSRLINSSSGGRLVGGIALDDCGSAVRARGLVEAALSGSIPGVDASRIVGVVGGGSGESAVAVAEQLASSGRTQISYNPAVLSASGSLFQSVSSSFTEASAVAAALEAAGVSYVQAVSASDSRSAEAASSFLSIAAARRICVTQSVQLGSSNHSAVAAAIAAKSSAPAVAAFVTAADAANILRRMSSPVQAVGGSLWGAGAAALSATQSVGALSLGQAATGGRSYASWASGNRSLTAEAARNPWYAEWYQMLQSCALTSSNAAFYGGRVCNASDAHNISATTGYQLSEFSPSVLRATAAYVQAIGSRVASVCSGTNSSSSSSSSSVCNAILLSTSLQSELAARFDNSSFSDYDGGSFRFVGRSASVGFSVYNVQNSSSGELQYIEVGSSQPTLTLRAGATVLSPAAATARCSSVGVCPECAAALRASNSLLYIPGDVLIGVLANVRSIGSDGTCGSVQSSDSGFAYTEAVRWALQLVNSGGKPDVRLGGSVKVGAVVLDACNSAAVAVSLATGVTRGSTALTDPSTGATIDVSRIRAWVSYGDATATSLAPALSGIGAPPLVSASAGSDSLAPLRIFRSVPTHSDQIATIIEILRANRWTCAHLAYSSSSYGQQLATEFRVQARRASICVPQCVQMPTDSNGAAAAATFAADATRTRVVVVLTDSDTDLQQLTASSRNLIFIGSSYWGERLNSISGIGPGANNSWILQPTAPAVAAVDEHLSRINPSASDNPWLPAYYQSLFNCSLTGGVGYSSSCNASAPLTSSPNYRQPLFTMPTLNAVFSISRAYADLLADLCGANYSSVCSNFWSDPRINSLLSDKLDGVVLSTLTGSTFEFRSGRDGNMGWFVYQRAGSSYVRVALHMLGSFITSSFPQYSARSSIYSSITGVCTSCTNCPKPLDVTEQFLYVPGQMLIAGLFDVHSGGSAPFSCGLINRENGFLLTEVFKYAIESIKTSPIFTGKLNGVTVGGLALDACSSSVRSEATISNLHSGVLRLKDAAGSTISPTSIFAYTGGATSDSAEQLIKVTDLLGLPLISYGATMSTLSNKQLYPLFSRTVPSDSRLAVAMAMLLQQRQINNVQLLLSPGSYGDSAYNCVQTAMSNAGICISNVLRLNRTGVGSVNDGIVAEQLLKRPSATAVVAFVEQRDLSGILRAVSLNNATAARFLFIGATPWGNTKTVLSGITNAKHPTAVTFAFESADLTDFENAYLRSKNPVSYGAVNPWFNEYYESVFDCSISSSSALYSRACDSTNRPITAASRYVPDPLAMYVVNSVYSAALGLHSALQGVCGANYTGVCSAFSAANAAARQRQVLNGIRAASFVDATGSTFRLDANGDSNRGYALQQLRTVGTAASYTAAGSYNTISNNLLLSSTLSLSWSSSCDSPAASCEILCPDLWSNRSAHAQSRWSAAVWLVQHVSAHAMGPSMWRCGPIHASGSDGTAQLLAFHFALDVMRNDSSLSSFSIGGISIDACGSAARAAALSYSMAAGRGLCGFATAAMLPPLESTVAFVSSDSAEVTASVASVVVNDSLISADSTSAALSNRATFPRFLTFASNMRDQVAALLAVAQRMNWTAITVLEDSSYVGQQCRRAVDSMIGGEMGKGVCLKYGGSAATATAARASLMSVSRDTTSSSNTLLLCLSEPSVRHLLRAISELRLQGRFALLATDEWADKMPTVAGRQMAAAGAVTLRRRHLQLPAFTNWVTQLRLEANDSALPADWLQELWQHSLRCRISGSAVEQRQYSSECNRTASLPAANQNAKTMATILSAYAAAKGIASFNAAECSNATSINNCLGRMPQAERQAALHRHIAAARWQALPQLLGSDSFTVKFSDGYASFGYDVLNFVRAGVEYEYRSAGLWLGTSLRLDRLQQYNPDGRARTAGVESRCHSSRAECGCSGASNNTITQLPQQDVWQRATEPWGLVALIWAGAGGAVSVCTLLYLLAAYPRKVQGTHGTNFLGLTGLFAVLLLFGTCVLFVPHATEWVCALRRTCLPITMSLVFSCLFIRSVAHWSLYQSDLAFSGVSNPLWLLATALAICLAPAAVCAQWLILQPPTNSYVAYEGVAWSRCNPGEFYDAGLALICLPSAALAIAALILSLLCWDAPMQDGRLTAMAVLVCLGSQLAWGCVSTLTAYKWRDPAVAFGSLASATTLLLCLFVRKVGQLCCLRNQPTPPPEYTSDE